MIHRIKVLFLVPSLRRRSPISGLVALAKCLDPDNFDITVSCLDALTDEQDSFVAELRRCGIKVKLFGYAGWSCMLGLRQVLRYVQSEGFHIVHSYGIRPDIINSLLSGSRIVMSFVRENIAHNYCSQYGSALGKPIAALHFYALRRLDHVVVVSKAIESDLLGRQFPPPRITHVKNWIDLKWMGNAARPALREEQGRAVLRVGSIGRLIPLKRVDWIIRAVGDLERRYPKLEIRLEIVGDGPSRSDLETLVDKLGLRATVTFHGHVYDVASVMRELDLVVLASESEGIPRVLMEAMSIGITCIGPRIGGIDELIIDNVTGYLFDANSYDHLVRTLGSVLCDRRFIEPSIVTEHVRNNCDAYAAARRLTSLYSSLKPVNCQ